MQNYQVVKIGSNRGIPRVWLQGRQPEQAGFTPGSSFSVHVERDRKAVILRREEGGLRRVSRKEAGGKEVPVIDINSLETLSVFKGLEQVRIVTGQGVIYILPLASEARKVERIERLRQKLQRGEALKVGSLSHGGGVLDLALHRGFGAEGLQTHLAFANDIRPELLEHASSANPAWRPDTVALGAPMQELVFDAWAMSKLSEVDALFAGIPCTGASLSGRAKNGTSCAEAHPDVGHLVVAFLAIIAKVNPALVVLENVVPYANTASMFIIRHQLRDLGYVVHETVLDGAEFNELEHRQRMCMVAVTEGISFDWSCLVKPVLRERRLGEILESVADDAPCWSEMGYLKAKEARDAAAGKGFAMQIVGPESTKVGTIGTGYAKNRSTEPKVQHPSRPELLRLLTPREHAACKGIPAELVEGLSATTAHEVLGQSIVFSAFVAVGELLARTLKRWFSVAEVQENELAALLMAA